MRETTFEILMAFYIALAVKEGNDMIVEYQETYRLWPTCIDFIISMGRILFLYILYGVTEFDLSKVFWFCLSSFILAITCDVLIMTIKLTKKYILKKQFKMICILLSLTAISVTYFTIAIIGIMKGHVLV